MLTSSQVQRFARDWIHSWNSHDLDAIMAHYADSVTLTSPAAVQLLNLPSGTLAGKQAVRDYFQHGLTAFPQLHFTLQDVMCGVSSIVLCFTNHKGTRTAEFMELDPDHKIIRVVANYSA